MSSLPRFVILLFAVLCAGYCASAQVHSERLTPGEIGRESARLDRSQIPNFSAQMHVDRKQSFRLTGDGFAPFSVVPVIFDSTSKENKLPTSRCGVFLLPAEGAATFVPTVGHQWTEVESCNELDGVGFVAGRDHPVILLLYTGSSPNAVTSEPVVLTWDAGAKRYAASQELSGKLSSLTTIPQMKAKLKTLVQP